MIVRLACFHKCDRLHETPDLESRSCALLFGMPGRTPSRKPSDAGLSMRSPACGPRVWEADRDDGVRGVCTRSREERRPLPCYFDTVLTTSPSFG